MTCSADGCNADARVKGMCRVHYKQAWYRANRERVRAAARERYYENPERNVAYRQANREKRRQQSREWREWNVEHRRAYKAQHRERDAAYNREWAERNPEKGRAKSRRWASAEQNREKLREAWRRRGWVQRGQHLLDGDARRFARVLLQDPCVYCGRLAGTVDHIVPFALEGTNEWDNLTSACRSCNSSKGSDSLLLFLTRGVSA